MARYDDIDELQPDLDGAGLRVGIVASRFNQNVVDSLLSACTEQLRQLGVNADDMLVVSVPGALETPLALQRMADSGRFDALVALGAVIRGETFHFEIVAEQSAAGVAAVQRDSGIPVANGILTTDNDDQAVARASIKGAEVARVAVEMANLVDRLDADDERG